MKRTQISMKTISSHLHPAPLAAIVCLLVASAANGKPISPDKSDDKSLPEHAEQQAEKAREKAAEARARAENAAKKAKAAALKKVHEDRKQAKHQPGPVKNPAQKAERGADESSKPAKTAKHSNHPEADRSAKTAKAKGHPKDEKPGDSDKIAKENRGAESNRSKRSEKIARENHGASSENGDRSEKIAKANRGPRHGNTERPDVADRRDRGPGQDEANRDESPRDRSEQANGGRDRDRNPAAREDRDHRGGDRNETAENDRRRRDRSAREVNEDVDRVAERIERRAERRKLDINDPHEARNLIKDILGRDSDVSRAEVVRESHGEHRRDLQRDRNREDIRSAADFLRRRLRGRADQETAPAFFNRIPVVEERREGRRWERSGDREDWREVRRGAPLMSYAPRYYHNGRRYVHFNSRSAIPAVLLASAALDWVNVQPARQVDRYFYNDNRDVYADPLPPAAYRDDDAVVVSYPVNKDSMITSNDIIFEQGSIRFADQHSYDMVMALANAIDDPGLNDARFVVEGHASAEGDYDDNMRLSQRRAEAIVRDLVVRESTLTGSSRWVMARARRVIRPMLQSACAGWTAP